MARPLRHQRHGACSMTSHCMCRDSGVSNKGNFACLAGISACYHDRTTFPAETDDLAFRALQVSHQALLNTQYEARNSTKAALDAGHYVLAPQGRQTRGGAYILPCN